MNKTCACETPNPYALRPSGVVLCMNLSCGLPIVTHTTVRVERP